MATNNFKPFGIAAGANVTSQADYEALAALLSGFQSGKASSAQINKALRQGTVMASVLAQYISDLGAVDVLDDGTPATILTNLKSAVQAASKAAAIPLMTGVVGQTRNLTMSVAVASATATVTAEEVIVSSALGGNQYRIGNFNKSINLGTTGAGGMDTGTAPANGFVAIYAIYNSVSGASALLGVNATSVKAPEVYGGANMPSGFTASALVGVVPLHTSSGQFAIFILMDRVVYFPLRNVLNTTSPTTTTTSLSISGAAPLNAREVYATHGVTQSVAGSGISLVVSSTLSAIANLGVQSVVSGQTGASQISGDYPMVVAQTLYYVMATTTAGVFSISIRGYSI